MLQRYARKLDKDWASRGRVFVALGDEHRQRMLLMFQRGEELTIKDIADACPLSRTAVAHHVRVLRESGVLLERKHGREVHLKPNPKIVVEAVNGLLDYIKENL
jgi:ArsR family transcriptional regulator, arsenate/arsenite/antimonite-responsive transcriptional repressor